ncbi:MAG: hypothetical protein H7145_23305 [Akkermansiaceae bacterium]|nr:hypothetical protein [Armatimonadota bacterium]
MRIIIKPVGAIFLVIALVTLAGLLFTKSRPAKIADAATTSGNPKSRSTRISGAGKSVINPESTKWNLVTQPPAQAAMEDTIVEELPGTNKHAVHLTVSQVDPAKFWSAQMIKEVPQDVMSGKEMVVHFWGRSLQSTPVWLIFEEGKSPHTPELQQKVTLTPEWKQYELPFRTTRDHIAPHANFCIKAGIQPGEIEVAGIYVDSE